MCLHVSHTALGFDAYSFQYNQWTDDVHSSIHVYQRYRRRVNMTPAPGSLQNPMKLQRFPTMSSEFVDARSSQ